MEQEEFMKSTICELKAAGTEETVKLIRFSDSGFVNMTYGPLCVNINLDLGDKMKITPMPNGTMRLAAIDGQKKNDKGEEHTIWWFDVDMASWLFQGQTPCA